MGATSEQRLHRADSLFVNASYIDALPLYESLLQRLQSASPAMLLRMAFIEEGAGNYTKALYYLNLYHLQIPNAAVALKMQELAARYNLLGYEFSDLDYFMIWYDRYYLYLAIGILLLNVCIFLIIVLRKERESLCQSVTGVVSSFFCRYAGIAQFQIQCHAGNCSPA